MRVLIAESDEQGARERAEQLRLDAHEPALALSIQAARLKLADLPDALVLGAVAAGSATIALLRELRSGAIPRADHTVPVLAIGADSDRDAIRYYRAGADALVRRDSSPLVIAAALEALGRRAGTPRPRQLRLAQLMIDVDARTAHVADRDLALTRLEFDLLQTLASQPGKAFTRAELTREVWGYDPAAVGPTRTVDSTAHRLRKKLDQAGAGSVMCSIRGVGWRLGR